jgi:hypothetical protein
VVKSGSVKAESTLCIGQKVSALQDPDEAAVYHAVHGLAQTTSQANRSVATSKGAIFPWFKNWYNHSFLPGSWDGALRSYTTVRGQPAGGR